MNVISEEIENRRQTVKKRLRDTFMQSVDRHEVDEGIEILKRLDNYLTPAEAHAAMAYYFDHQEEIDREINAEWDQAQRERLHAERSPFYTRLRAKGLL